MELIERDSVSIWWYNRLRRPAVDLESFYDESIDRVRHHHEGIDRELWALDLQTDLGVPVFAALSRRLQGESEDILLGFGAHPVARLALRTALSEMNQSLSAVYPRSPSDDAGLRYSNQDAMDWWRSATLRTEPYLAPGPGMDALAAADYPELADTPPSAMLSDVVSALAGHGLDVLALDQSRPDTGLHVARVVVPGLRPFWPRFAGGRLYDVPVRLGWRKKPLEEEALNPRAIYF